jgi:hypothetical protein
VDSNQRLDEFVFLLIQLTDLFIQGGKPITPTGDQSFLNGSVNDSQVTENGTTVVDGATKLEVSYFLYLMRESSFLR